MKNGTSKHYTNDRQARENIAKKIGGTHYVKKVLYNYKGKIQKHYITDTAIIEVRDNDTDMLITKLIARPGQIKRYYEKGKAPKELINVAYEHLQLGYNMT